MSGCTITRVADTLDQLFSEMRKQILAAAKTGLEPDSDLVVIDNTKDKARIFKVNVYHDLPFYPKDKVRIDFAEVDKGRTFHVGMAGLFGPKPDEGQLIGTIHVHS